MTNNTSLYTFQFLLLCLSHVLFAASFTMIIPELPAYLTSLGGEDYKGLIISLFTITAGLSRPFSGKLTDTIGRMPVMIIGTLVCVVCSLMYPILSSVGGFLLLRFLHGFSTGFKPTASTAYAADIVPVDRRGEAMGILGVSMNTGASIAPPVGSYFAMNYSMDIMFYASSAMALISILILLGMKESLENKQPFQAKLLRIKKDEIIDRSAIPPAIVTVLFYYSYGVVLTIVPDQSEYLGLENKGLFFTGLTAFSVLSRLFAGKISDRLGRVPILMVGGVMIGLSLLVIGFADSVTSLMVGGACLGFATGSTSPAVFAWTIDRCKDEHRGRALATVYIALEIGIGMGAFLSALTYNNQPENFGFTFFLTAIGALMATVYLIAFWRKNGKRA